MAIEVFGQEGGAAAITKIRGAMEIEANDSQDFLHAGVLIASFTSGSIVLHGPTIFCNTILQLVVFLILMIAAAYRRSQDVAKFY